MDLTPIQPVAAIIAATITAGAGALVTYFMTQKRKKVTFVIGKTEDLTAPMHARTRKNKILVENIELDSFNRAEVHIRNTGNVAIQTLFSIS